MPPHLRFHLHNYLVARIAGNTAGAGTQLMSSGTLVLAGGNNITLSQDNGSTVTISAAAQTVESQSAGVSNLGNTAGTSGIASGGQVRLVLAGGNNVTLSQSLNGASATITISAANETQTVPPIATSVKDVGVNSSIGTITRFAPEDHIHPGVNYAGLSNLGNTSGTSTVSAGRLVLAGGNNITLSQATDATGSTITVSGRNQETLSWFEYPVGALWGATKTVPVSSNTHYVAPFILMQPLSASYLRLIASWDVTSTSFATSAVPWSTTFSVAGTQFAVVYSQGVGASSRSLQAVVSGSAGYTWQVSATGANNTNNWTVTHNITWPQEGGVSNTGINYASTLSTVRAYTTNLTDFTGTRFLDIPFANSLPPGNYWLALNEVTTTGGGKGIDMAGRSVYMMSQLNTAVGNLGAATNSSLQPQAGLGSWTTNVTGTTASIALASISSSASHPRPYFQLIRQN